MTTTQTITKTHWFASCALGWATAETGDEAIEKLVNHLGRKTIGEMVRNAQRDGEPGVYVWLAHVDAPPDTPYKIQWFAPVGVDIMETIEYYLTHVTVKKIAKFLLKR